MGLACHRASPARRQAARTESSVAGPPCCICIVVEFWRHHKVEDEKHSRPRMQRTDANVVRLRRALSPPLQHQRKLGCFVEHRVRHDVRRAPPTDASVSAHQLFLNLPPMMVKVAGQKSDDPRGTQHTHQHYYQHQPHAKNVVLFSTTEDITTLPPVLQISNF